MKNYTKYLMVTVKGACMGAADVIPGVSGGTIAFMTGIYEELIGSINAIDTYAVKMLFTGRLKAFWKHINGNFLVCVFAGILLSVLSLAKLMQFLLSTYPIHTWAFFFGLIVASSIFILRGVKDWNFKDVIFLAAGTVLWIVVCTLSPTQTPDGLWFIFLSGSIAICAMILPGISGSFILLILGKYEYIMNAIVDMDIAVLAVFATGAAAGILAFSKFLHWLLARYHRQTLVVLAGFIIGSLVKVWPWSNMEAIVRSQFSIPEGMPGTDVISEAMAEYTGLIDYHIAGAICFAIIGFALVTGIEMAGKALKSNARG